MVKVSDKLPKFLLGSEDFKKEFNACVWSDLLEPDEFNIIWNDIMEGYGLEDVHWFGSMFEDREFWVPAYFRDFPMGSLLRTTSMSESENSFFKNYTKPRANLVQFINFFNCDVGDQRNVNSRLNYLDYSTIPDLSTQLPIEKHASTIYTDSIFKHVQKEISMVCEIVSITVEDNIKMHKVKDQYGRPWDVKYDCKQDTFDCSCKKFSRIGLLCCHIFCLLKNKSANLIPEKYFDRRWLKSSLLKAAHGLPFEEQLSFERNNIPDAVANDDVRLLMMVSEGTNIPAAGADHDDRHLVMVSEGNADAADDDRLLADEIESIKNNKKRKNDDASKKKAAAKKCKKIVIQDDTAIHSPTLAGRRNTDFFVNMLETLNKNKKRDVREFGFGALLNFKIRSFPRSLAYYLIYNFNHKSCSIKLNNEESLFLDDEDVHITLGFPMGSLPMSMIKFQKNINIKSEIARFCKG
ncbi:protein FAR1-RELATED SEQUENCE 5-like [Salvia splendens]|uniref:protein FAR1-RELATED SEQUENCE 5-like n=1 Tax=Salvia splendens TaxID=180675 RepID=UPI001C2761DA|nr:protein FAR1-RELATED SEQUENCE 5-like [Salvia splendens]